MCRFSGAFGWNPPFPPGVAVGNKKGAMPPDSNEYWNYGSDGTQFTCFTGTKVQILTQLEEQRTLPTLPAGMERSSFPRRCGA